MNKASLILGMLSFVASSAAAEDLPVFHVEMKDGVITPQHLEVPAKTKIKIVVKNTGSMPAELENLDLHKEAVVPAGSESSMIIRTLDPGEYQFFDDFQIGEKTPMMVIAK